MIADKYQVTSVIINGLYPELTLTIEAYEKLIETVGEDSVLIFFNEKVEAVKKTYRINVSKSSKNKTPYND